MITINDWLMRQFPAPPCWHLVAAWYDEVVSHPVTEWKTVNPSVRSIASAFSIAIHKNPDGFRQVIEPQDHAIVLLGKSLKLGVHHTGIYYQGRVLHALDDGSRYDEMTVITDAYPLVEYWVLT